MASEPAGDQERIELENEQRLIEEAQQGNLDAMRPILERYAQPLYGTVILPRLGDTASAEEVLRDTLATAVEKIKRFTWQGKTIYPWLRQIAINKVFDVHRQSKRSRRLADAMAHEIPRESDPETHADAQLIADQERTAHRARIADTMQLLAERYRTAIELRLIQELPREECAKRLGVTIGTFDVLLFRAVRAFRKHFGERHELPGEPVPQKEDR
ncbi:MAG: RNA polymerase sigma factor [Deltaproteobacteria bacterium]|nr:RNA polymerase sigma factor [Deltaproteobacteria bacterium]MDQ3301372.1 RNA polymerase sigma factor [Myxococcota bacterium]